MIAGLRLSIPPCGPLFRSWSPSATAALFCTDINALNLLQRAGNLDKLEALKNYAESDLLGEQEKAALAYADGISAIPVAVDVSLQKQLMSFFSAEEIAELTGLIAFQKIKEALHV